MEKMNELTEEQVREHINDLLFPKGCDNIVFMEGCKTNGLVIRDSSAELNLCGDPTCKSCSDLRKGLIDYIKSDEDTIDNLPL